jgi:hypothetical protein
MRTRLFIGNVLATLIAGAFVFALSRTGLGALTSAVLGASLLVVMASIASIRVVNDLLRRLSHVEEAVLRVSHGEADVRLGAVEAPYDGLAYRLDQLFEMVEQQRPNEGDESPS